MSISHDVIILGAGPAGSTAAALLARAGRRVLVLEKEDFPRFHVGESLLPAGMPILDRLGLEQPAERFLFKRGAEFVCERTNRSQFFPFDEALPGCASHAWHVDRADFDTALRDKARESGADVRHGETVTEVALHDDEQVSVLTSRGRHIGRYFVDASGQDRFLGKQQDSVEPYTRFGSAAAFSRFDGVSDAAWQEIGPGHDIRIMLRSDGWGWLIPLPGRRLSVGMVSRDRMTLDTLDEGLLSGPLASRWTAGARRAQSGVIRNFSFRNTRPSGARHAVLGDAACFLDPIFSSGVVLAMRGAESLADLLAPALEAGAEADPGLLDTHHEQMDRAYRTFAALIDRFYNTRFAESMFLGDSTDNALRAGVMSVLAGDVWRTDNPFQELLLRARRHDRQAL